MSQKVSKVNVEQLALFIDHDVIRVSITDAENEGGHAKAGTAAREVLDGFVEVFFIRVVGNDPFVQLVLVPDLELTSCASECLDLEYGHWVLDHFDETDVMPGRYNIVQ